MAYINKKKQKQADRDRQRRYRAKAKGVTQSVTKIQNAPEFAIPNYGQLNGQGLKLLTDGWENLQMRLSKTSSNPSRAEDVHVLTELVSSDTASSSLCLIETPKPKKARGMRGNRGSEKGLG